MAQTNGAQTNGAKTNGKTSAIDWTQVRERLRASELALAEALAESPARIEAAYRKRAVQIASGQRRSEPAAAVRSALIFRLGPERYAIDLSELSEVLPLVRYTQVPGAPAAFLGVINLRGELRPIVDLGRVILPMENGASGPGFVLMLRRQGQVIGVRVDQVEGLCEIPCEKVGSPEQGKYTKRIAGEALSLLDVERVIAEVVSKEELLTA